jgi:arylsulfatase A-like enzyme
VTQTSRTYLYSLTGLAAVLAAATLTTARAAPRKPNIVYIMADELGYYEPSYMGNPNLKTPNIDRMAKQGIHFTQALAGSSVCAPTRGCLMTGKHSGHTSVRSNGGGTPLRAGEATVASVLKAVGYATGGFGKWGCGGRGSTGVPEKHGFDVFLGYYDQVHAHSYYPPYIVRNSEEMPLKGNKGGSNGETYSQYVIADAAMQFIRDNQNKTFFCYMPVTPPHGIFDIPDSDPAWATFKDKPWPEQVRRYAAMVGMLDRQVGDVLDLLKELGLDRDTLVFFCGDNGGADYFKSEEHPRGFHGANVHPKTGKQFRGRKGNLYEGGLRIPMIAYWPGKIAPGRVSDLLWYFPDVLPTLADVAGATPPEDTDGISIVPELLGQEAAGREQEQHEYLYWELGSQAAVRMGHWKAVRPGSKAKWELYDLREDIEEKTSVTDGNAEILAKMTAFAKSAHEPVREGVFHDRAIHERDRQAKYGFDKGARSASNRNPNANRLPTEGLIPRKQYKLVRVSSESRSNTKTGACAFDGNPNTWWHSEFTPNLAKHPHELVIDLGKTRTVRGIRYLARQDGGWNGAVKACELLVSDKADAFAGPAIKRELAKSKKAQEVVFPPVRGRYIMLRALSEVSGNPWASVAEFGVIGE